MTKKYYKKKNYYREYNYSSYNELDPLYAIIILLIFALFSVYYLYIRPNTEYIINLVIPLIPIIILIFISIISLIIYLKYKWLKKEKERMINIPIFLRDLESKIKEFKPVREYNEELLYQIELVWFLKNNYPNLKIEETKDYKRPDIVIDDIAIEIKWPTDMSSLKTLPDKINSYLSQWNYLFIVLFNINIVEDREKNIEIYENKKREILENTIDSKKDKIFFIEYFS